MDTGMDSHIFFNTILPSTPRYTSLMWCVYKLQSYRTYSVNILTSFTAQRAFCWKFHMSAVNKHLCNSARGVKCHNPINKCRVEKYKTISNIIAVTLNAFDRLHNPDTRKTLSRCSTRRHRSPPTNSFKWYHISDNLL